MIARDPLSSLVVPVPPYRGRGAVLPQVRLASTDGPPGRSEDDLLQAGSALEAQDQAAQAAEDIAEQPKPNPLENMALSLAIEQQEEAVRQEAGQAHTNIDTQPPLNDADIAAKHEAHAKVAGVESGAVGDIAAVGAEAQPATSDAEQAEMEAARAAMANREAEERARTQEFSAERAKELREGNARKNFASWKQKLADALGEHNAGERALADARATGKPVNEVALFERVAKEGYQHVEEAGTQMENIIKDARAVGDAELADAFQREWDELSQAQAAQRASEQEVRSDAVTHEQVAEAQKEPPKEPEPGNPSRGGRFKVDVENLREMFAEKIAAATNPEELYAAIRAADGNIVNERGVRYGAEEVIRNIEGARALKTADELRTYIANGLATSALGIRAKARELLINALPASESAGAFGRGLADMLIRQAKGIPMEAVSEGSHVEAAPAVAAQERQEPTPQEREMADLRRQVEELRSQLGASQRPAGAEAVPAAAQEFGAAAAGGAEGPPQEPEFGPEQPEVSGAEEMAMEAIDGVRELGSDQELGFWERKGMQSEAVLHDMAAWWSGAWAVRAKNSQKNRERKIRSLERTAQRESKTFMGALLNPLKYGWRINYHRWREGLVRAASERHNDRRTRYETARNDVLSRVAAHMEVPLRTAESRTEQNRLLLEQADTEVTRLHGLLSAIAIRQRQAQGPELDILMERHAAFVEQLREAESARNVVYQAFTENNSEAGRIQRINNQILKKQNPGDRPAIGAVPRQVLRPRAPVPLPRAPAA